MTLNIVSSFNGVSDPDAAAYIEAVEAADGELLEFAVGKAINDFVLGCKADGIWDVVKASCILAGARTLNGALVPLAGAAPTNFNFVAGDYNRKTGLLGDSNNKYLNSNRFANSDPNSSRHISVYISSTPASTGRFYMGCDTPRTALGIGGLQYAEPAIQGANFYVGNRTSTGLMAVQSTSSTSAQARVSGITYDNSSTILAPPSIPYYVFGNNLSGTPSKLMGARLAFYSIGESLDLAKLDSRVTDLITAFGAAIP